MIEAWRERETEDKTGRNQRFYAALLSVVGDYTGELPKDLEPQIKALYLPVTPPVEVKRAMDRIGIVRPHQWALHEDSVKIELQNSAFGLSCRFELWCDGGIEETGPPPFEDRLGNPFLESSDLLDNIGLYWIGMQTAKPLVELELEALR